jgi:methylthioribose-1-phosphate isomerase
MAFMRINGKHYRTIWSDSHDLCVNIIDQSRLPHRFEINKLERVEDAATAISDMQVRGAPLIGATAAYAVCLALKLDPSDKSLDQAYRLVLDTRPTAINLKWALDRMVSVLQSVAVESRLSTAFTEADRICEEDVEACLQIGRHGLKIIESLYQQNPDRPVNILTHCNAGWLATIDWGTATSPVYQAQLANIPVHVWVDETRPRNQGAALTCFELAEQQVPHTLIVDNAGGHLMQLGEVDMVITGTDRTARNGDVANKIGTYLKALAAKDNNVPFYVALPSSTIDWNSANGHEIPIEHRNPDEVTHIQGMDEHGNVGKMRISPPSSPALNPAFDVTPAELVTGLITERGVTRACEEHLVNLYPEVSGGGN